MARRYKIRVFVKGSTPSEAAREDLAKNFAIEASNVDKAATIARARLEENAVEVVSLSHGPEDTILVTIARAPRTALPTTLIANVARKG